MAFDLDDTLAPSKTAIDTRMAELLVQLLDRVEVCIISGGQYGQFTSQVIEKLGGADNTALERLHLMPTCGTQYFRYVHGVWSQIYSQNLSEDEKARAFASLEESARDLGLWESETWGPILEDRGSQVTFSALGQSAPVGAKMAWDPDGAKKNSLRMRVAAQLPDLEVRSGGSTSIDITRHGIDKAYGMRRLEELTSIPLSEMLFVGDRLDEGGNDYPVKALGVECVAVANWEDTVRYLKALIPNLPVASPLDGAN